MKKQDVETVYIAGLATDVCVKYTALDALKLGLDTYVVIDGCRGVNMKAGDIERAIEEMKDTGVEMVQSDQLVKEFSN